jgi:GDP-4-dehydro-6-deoxy-D-mannose reductase
VRVLITGITGFVGSHLAQQLVLHPELEVFGLRRWRSNTSRLGAPAESIRFLEGDLLDPPSLLRVLQACQPGVIFHLAASSSVSSSWQTPTEMLQVNAVGTLHLLEAVRQLQLDATVVLACSAESYGIVKPSELPITEEQPFRPVSPYAVSKATVDLLGFQYFRAFGVRTVRLRLFNHCGPGQSDQFVIAAFARQLAEIEAGRQPPRLAVGNLDVSRDFVDVRDAARAYWLAASRGEAGEAYNVASGRSRTLRSVLEELLAMSPAQVEVVVEEARLRPAEIPVLEGAGDKFQGATGWRPEVPFAATLRDTLAYWREKVRRRS